MPRPYALSVTAALSLAGIIDDEWFTQEAAKRGTDVHLLCKHDDLGSLRSNLNLCGLADTRNLIWVPVDLRQVPAAQRPYLRAWRDARREIGITRWLAIEQEIESRDGYRGTPDRIAEIGSGPQRVTVVIDIKSQAHRQKVPMWAAIQLAGYAHAYKPHGFLPRIAVGIHGDGTFHVERFGVEDYLRDVRRFLACLEVARMKAVNLP